MKQERGEEKEKRRRREGEEKKEKQSSSEQLRPNYGPFSPPHLHKSIFEKMNFVERMNIYLEQRVSSRRPFSFKSISLDYG